MARTSDGSAGGTDRAGGAEGHSPARSRSERGRGYRTRSATSAGSSAAGSTASRSAASGGRTATKDAPRPSRAGATSTRATRPGTRTGRTTGTARAEAPRRRPRKPGSPTRRRALLRRWTALLVFFGLVAGTVALLYTPLLGVRSVEVSGNMVLTSGEVISAAEVSMGAPMLRLDTDAIRTRIGLLTRVATVDVVREWPSTVLIEVTERQPAATFAGPGGVHLVDSTGQDFATVPTPPPGLPTLALRHVAPTDPTTRSVLAVLAAVPSQLRPQLVSIGARTPGGVRFTLTTGKTVIWGDATDSARKGAVLAALLSQPGKVYDVSAPDLPTVS